MTARTDRTVDRWRQVCRSRRLDRTETVEKLDDTGIRLVRRLAGTPVFPERMARARVVHNVEEVGVLGHLLPDQRHRTSRGRPST
ncbi:hypothetical protein [Nocardioides sp. P5_C9_2]